MTYRLGLAALLLVAACKEKTSASAPPPTDAAAAPPVAPARGRVVNLSGAPVRLDGAEVADGALGEVTGPGALARADGTAIGTAPDGDSAIVARAAAVALVSLEPVAPPPPGQGVVVLRGDALRGAAYTVGDGAGHCLHQRLQDDGYAAALLGGAYPVVVDLPPGAQHIALHRWPGKACTTEVVHDLTVEVAAGAATDVFVRRADDGTVTHLTIAR